MGHKRIMKKRDPKRERCEGMWIVKFLYLLFWSSSLPINFLFIFLKLDPKILYLWMGIDSVEFFTMKHVLWVFREGMLTRSLPFLRKIMKSVVVGKFSKFVLQASVFNSTRSRWWQHGRAPARPSGLKLFKHTFRRSFISPCRLLSHILCLSVERTNFPLFFNCAFLSTSIHLSLSPPTVWCLYTFECCVHVF